MFSDAGRAFARQLQDASNILELSCLYTTIRNFLVSFRHFPDHHLTLLVFLFMVVGDPLITSSSASLLHQSSNLWAAVDESYSPLVLARSLKVKLASTLESELNHTHASRSMDSSRFATIANSRPHQKSTLHVRNELQPFSTSLDS